MESLKGIIAKEFEKILKETISPLMIKDVPPEIEGDFAFPCFAFAKKAKKDPKKLAEELAKKVKPKYIARAEAKDGFVNFFVDAKALAPVVLGEIAKQREGYGRGGKKGKIIVEHTSANPDAPLHVGHLRNSVIGDSTARILGFAGYDVETQFYINDMGGQLAILAKWLGDNHPRVEGKPDVWLGQQYVRANESVDPTEAKATQIQYERGNRIIKQTFDFIVDTALRGFKETFSHYNISIDRYVRESDFVFNGDVKKVLDKLKKSELWIQESEVFALELEKYGIDKELVLLRSDGTTLYTTRDLAYHLWKLKQADCVNVIANEQTLQQKQLRAGLDMLGVQDVDKRVRHLSYELVSIPGMRMSSRTGQFVSADQILAEGTARALDEIRERNLDVPEGERGAIARAVAMGAIRYNMVKITPLKPITFKWEEALNFDGESAPYLQYSHARACRILEKAGAVPAKVDFSKIELSNEESRLLRILSQFGGVVEAAADDLKPNLLANHLYSLGEAFNRFYFKCPVLESKEPLRGARILIVDSTRQVLANGLSLLGIEALGRM
jgi:arginyl-tRNA synthetase